MIKRLKPKHWLNDEIINSYIQLMESDILKKNVEQKNIQNKE
jgi:Ulp1 family protease